jgi:hypothetical protein
VFVNLRFWAHADFTHIKVFVVCDYHCAMHSSGVGFCAAAGWGLRDEVVVVPVEMRLWWFGCD